ncbi:MAG: hypothetical protein ACYC26_10480, partial [Phycisphaerales bacterium]
MTNYPQHCVQRRYGDPLHHHGTTSPHHQIGFSYVATCQPVLGWGAGIVSGSGQSAIGARNLDGHAAHEIVY